MVNDIINHWQGRIVSQNEHHFAKDKVPLKKEEVKSCGGDDIVCYFCMSIVHL